MDLTAYRSSPREQFRIRSLMELVPKGLATVLDVGARDGFLSRTLTSHFKQVIALDLEKPAFEIDRVRTVKGDVTALQFDDGGIDCVFCAEVLEHIPPALLPKACRELARVARSAVVIGVPYRQDLRVGRTRCQSCGQVNPPWGHVNRFDEQRLFELFAPLHPAAVELVWPTRADRTNIASATLMDLAGYPWGTYNQEEPCITCGAPLVRPSKATTLQRACGRLSRVLDDIQSRFTPPIATWLHVRFEKGRGVSFHAA